MTIEEIERLGEDEQNKRLRLPKPLLGESQERLMMAHEQFVIIIDDIIRNKGNKDIKNFTTSLYGKYKMLKAGISKVQESDNWVGSYSIKTKLGKGEFFDAHRLFPNNKYARWIKPKHCFSNTHLYILQTKLEAKVLSGIVFIGKPFLHSVLLIDDNIIDFNYDLVMSKDLYFTLTHFEVLAELDHKQLLENEKLIRKMKGVQSHVFNFAFEEVIEKEKRKQGITDGVGVQ